MYIYIYYLSFHCEISRYYVVRLNVYFGRKKYNYLGKSSVYFVRYIMINYSDTSSGSSQSIISLYFGSLRRFFLKFSRAS